MKKRILVVGSDLDLIKNLMNEGHEVLVANSLKSENDKHLYLDMNSLASSKNFIREFHNRFAYLDGLVFTESLYIKDKHLSEDGYNKMLMVNFLAPFIITEGLKVTLSTEEHARVIFLGSKSGFKGDYVDMTDDKYSHQGYANSKFMLMMYALHLSHHLKDDHVTVNILCESIEEKNFVKKLFTKKQKSFDTDVLSYLLLSDDLRYKTGKMYDGKHVMALPQDKFGNIDYKEFYQKIKKQVK